MVKVSVFEAYALGERTPQFNDLHLATYAIIRGGDLSLEDVRGFVNDSIVELDYAWKAGRRERAKEVILEVVQPILQTEMHGDHLPFGMTVFAYSLHEQGRYPHAAAALCELGMEWSIERLGPEDREALLARRNWALSLRFQGRYDEAIEIHEDLVRIFARNFGPTHRDTIHRTRELANALVDAGRPDEAAGLLTKEVERAQQAEELGREEVLMTMDKLARIYIKAGKEREAAALLIEAIEHTPRHDSRLQWRRDRLEKLSESGG